MRFSVARDDLQEFYDRDTINRTIIRMRSAGGVVATDLPPRTIATRFLPALAERLVRFADEQGFSQEDALDRIGVYPAFWQIGIA